MELTPFYLLRAEEDYEGGYLVQLVPSTPEGVEEHVGIIESFNEDYSKLVSGGLSETDLLGTVAGLAEKGLSYEASKAGLNVIPARITPEEELFGELEEALRGATIPKLGDTE